MIDIRDLTFSYPGQPNLFDTFDLTINKGEMWSIIGPSGCGKSTLLYFISRLIIPGLGMIRIDDEVSSRPRPRTGLVLQDHGLLPWSTVLENVSLGLDIRRFYGPDGRHAPAGSKMDRAAGQQTVDHWLKRLGIDELRGKYPSQMSRGQRQRAALARTLALSPDLLLMDEPFSALDAPTRKDLQDLVVELNRDQNLTCITVTHAIEEAVFMGSRILILQRGINRNAVVMDNPAATDARHDEFQQMCERIGETLEASV